MRRSNQQKPEGLRNIAKERIAKLLHEASENFAEHPQLSRRYVSLARKIAMRYKVKFTREQKFKFCKQCGAYLVQGNNARQRLEKGKIVLTCLECNAVRRFVYKK